MGPNRFKALSIDIITIYLQSIGQTVFSYSNSGLLEALFYTIFDTLCESAPQPADFDTELIDVAPLSLNRIFVHVTEWGSVWLFRSIPGA
jgi:hypothetical protein